MTSFLHVSIERFVDEYQPGFVECSIVDARGTKHIFIEKIPVVTTENLWSDSTYPRPGVIACQIENGVKIAADDGLLQVNTEFPWHVESTDGQTLFTVKADQVRIDRDA